MALTGFQKFLATYPNSTYAPEAKELLVGVMANTNNYRDAVALMDSLPNLSENTKAALSTGVVWSSPRKCE